MENIAVRSQKRVVLAAQVMGVLVLLSTLPIAITSAWASPVVTGPIAGVPANHTALDLGKLGYVEEEFFLEGTAANGSPASGYTNTAPLTSDGNWQTAPSGSADYKTRILVRRPIDQKRFNGTVVVEWLNVSGGVDATATWNSIYGELLRDGFAWVGLSAQKVGIDGFPGTTCPPGGTNTGLKCLNPARYGSLNHPGDTFSYDFLSQAAMALRSPVGADPMGGLKFNKLVAIGDSQSAFFLTTYIDGVQPLVKLYDGFLVQSRGHSAAPLSEVPLINAPAPTFFRTDQVPILVFITETDLVVLGYFFDRQPDAPMFRDWEVAGESHADKFSLQTAATDSGIPLSSIIGSCVLPINDGPGRYVEEAAIKALNVWVNGGPLPPVAPRIDIGPGPTIERDSLGNALGGIRTPLLDVPFAAYSGLGNTSSGPVNFCFLFGTTIAFDDSTLDSLYRNHGAYLSKFIHSTSAAQHAGFILQPGAQQLKGQAAHSSIGK